MTCHNSCIKSIIDKQIQRFLKRPLGPSTGENPGTGNFSLKLKVSSTGEDPDTGNFCSKSPAPGKILVEEIVAQAQSLPVQRKSVSKNAKPSGIGKYFPVQGKSVKSQSLRVQEKYHKNSESAAPGNCRKKFKVSSTGSQ